MFLNHYCISYVSDISSVTFCLMIWFIILHVCFSAFLLWFDSWLTCIRCLRFHSARCSDQLMWLNQSVWFVFTIFSLISCSFCSCFFLVSAHLCLMIVMLSASFRARLTQVDWFSLLLSLSLSSSLLLGICTVKYHLKSSLMKERVSI